MRTADTVADILYVLSDGRVHTLQEIADEIEVSKWTVQKHIAALAYRYPINHVLGRGDKQGMQLDKAYIHNGKIRSRDELQLIEKALRLLQKSDASVDQEMINALIQDYSVPTKMEDSKAI